MHRWGLGVIDRLPLSGAEVVLDAGCGSGRVTEALLERLPGGRVIALDASPAMLEEARRRLARFGDRVTYVEADLGRSLPIEQPIDHILSTATFHWVADHDALFRNLAAVIRPGGRLVAQCGGIGNIAGLVRVIANLRPGLKTNVNFATPLDTVARLEAAGFMNVEAWLVDAPVRLAPGEQLAEYLETVCLRTYADQIPASERTGFVADVGRAMPEPVIDYVRININATRR
ncbi:MAG: methyltransferase domain-containing protein [Candidatus Limnocylindrales bacterium]